MFTSKGSVRVAVSLERAKNCKFDAMLTAKKSRAEKYDIKLAIKGTFEDVIKASVIPMPVGGKVQPKKDKPKKK